MGPRRGGLNGRRNAVKPFCHSRRSRARRGEGYSVPCYAGTRAPLASSYEIENRFSRRRKRQTGSAHRCVDVFFSGFSTIRILRSIFRIFEPFAITITVENAVFGHRVREDRNKSLSFKREKLFRLLFLTRNTLRGQLLEYRNEIDK